MSQSLPTYDSISAPLISIIMAAKDTEPYIEECVTSIQAQTYPYWELIAVNDHSTDRTREILDEFSRQDPRIRVFDSPGQRLNPALREGMRHATGMLINRMDSDDRMPSDKLSTLLDHWLRYGKGHVIAGGTEHFVDDGEVGDGFRRYESWLNLVAREGKHVQEIYRECVIPSHCWIIHRDDLLTSGGFDPDVYPEDYDLCFRFYRNNLTIIGIDKVLHYWRDRSDRISRTWEEYSDNRYFDLKLRYFYELDRKAGRPLVVWGAGRNGKELVRKIMRYEKDIRWVCDNQRKMGKDIYGLTLEPSDHIQEIDHPQILIAVASENDREEVTRKLTSWGKKPVSDFWFFL